MTERHTLEQLRTAFRYEPETGHFYWLVRRSNSHQIGHIAGSRRGGRADYWRLRFDGVEYEAHRLAWLFMTDEWPEGLVDHRDLDKLNNRWANLRAATVAQNAANAAGRGAYPKGVTLHKNGRYQAQIKTDGRNHYLGLFDTPQEANAAYAAKAAELFGEFARAA